MASLSVADASRLAGVSVKSMVEKIDCGELRQSNGGINVDELIRVYPNLKPLSSLKIRKVKRNAESVETQAIQKRRDSAAEQFDARAEIQLHRQAHTEAQAGTVELLVRELEWNKELLEQTNQLMAKQLADQRALIADQARRLDEKDRFWARQVEIAQSLLPAPAPVARKKFLGIF